MNFDLKQFFGTGPREPEAMVASTDSRSSSSPCAFIDRVTGAHDPKVGVGILSGLFALASILPAILIDIKCWQDRDKSGWWMLITLVPIIGSSCSASWRARLRRIGSAPHQRTHK